jgi:nucleoside-diphosphate-sugar epimerase
MSVLYTAVQAALKNQSLSVSGRDIARDYCYIDDVTEAFIHLLFQPKLKHLVYNVGSPQAFTLDQVLETLQTMVPGFSWKDSSVNEAEVSLIETSARAGLNVDRLKEDANWTPNFSLHKGLQTYLEWLKSNQMS